MATKVLHIFVMQKARWSLKYYIYLQCRKPDGCCNNTKSVVLLKYYCTYILVCNVESSNSRRMDTFHGDLDSRGTERNISLKSRVGWGER
jgi:hypothetical protein